MGDVDGFDMVSVC